MALASGPIRIAHILSSFGMGGQERVALELAVRQRARGEQVLAVSLKPDDTGALLNHFRSSGVRLENFGKRDGFDPGLVYRLARLFRSEEVQVVHSHNPQPLIYGAPAAWLSGARAVHTKHGANPMSRRQRVLCRVAGRLVSAFVAVSETTAQIARANREIAERRLHVIPNGIDLSLFHPDREARALVRQELDIPQSAFVVGTVGRLKWPKNQQLLLRAMEPLLAPDCHLLVIGDGPDGVELQAQREAMAGKAQVHLLGARTDVARLMPAFDLFALSSESEGLPLVIPEAMAVGLPILSTSVGGIPQVVDDGLTGYLTPAGDDVRMRARVSELKADAARRKSMGERGRTLALERYSADRMADDYSALYRAILGAPPPTPGATIDVTNSGLSN